MKKKGKKLWRKMKIVISEGRPPSTKKMEQISKIVFAYGANKNIIT